VRNTSYGYTLVTNSQWRCSVTAPTGWQNFGFDDSVWPEAHEIGMNGIVPGCSWIPLPAFPPAAYWVWSENYIGVDPIMQCRGYTPVCSHAPCLNGGTCQMNAEALCVCPVRYTGQFCETEFDECDSIPCQNGGVCENTDEGYRCECPLGYTGVHCETDTSDCGSNPCQNGATCVFDIEGGYACSCANGYTGDHCETMIDYCESGPCENGATCTAVPGNVVCACMPGYSGFFCQTQINYCMSNPCQHGSTCVPGINNYQCQCHPGYTGVHCESPLGDCTTNPCQNGGTCTLGGAGGSVLCICPDGFFGQFCELNEDFCESNPCMHGGSCLSHAGGYQCFCNNEYTGLRCETVIANCGNIMLTASYEPARGFWALCEINIIDHPQYLQTPCRDLIVGINHFNNSQGIIEAGGTFGCFVTRFPDEMADGACIRNYNQDQFLGACLTCSHMAVCIDVPRR